MDDVPAAAHAALTARDWERLRLLLHPYLHWTRADGSVLRGRTKITDWLHDQPPPEPPAAVELRDDQIYRWFESPNGMG